VIGAGFGLIFVLVNTGSFPAAVAVLFRVLAVLAFIAVLLAVVVAERRPSPASADRPMGGGFTLGYWLVVVAEVGAIAAGLAVLNGPLHAPQAAVAWIALVVGIHFIALAAVWKLLFFHGLGVALMLCGVAGLVLAAAGSAVGPIDLAGGVMPGAILLGFGLWGATRSRDGLMSAPPGHVRPASADVEQFG
jgi:hypothetical protein